MSVSDHYVGSQMSIQDGQPDLRILAKHHTHRELTQWASMATAAVSSCSWVSSRAGQSSTLHNEDKPADRTNALGRAPFRPGEAGDAARIPRILNPTEAHAIGPQFCHSSGTTACTSVSFSNANLGLGRDVFEPAWRTRRRIGSSPAKQLLV
ncbi:uncharacterized protein LY79DRAFT_85877 [Colletotrichum navitas]|uniref:Uncharacterized protein n=1 Tax=Colletotrichum navitas TaxID=681940 RepID=A0AAD8PKI7_9PEZI|nr:uncharacterized protein LY79DRAFT_85877 [Colletotrichum navitas]KAK1569488.1 hypothetical protein LY79DRAFT_85877 [Colletotrichum navitas]